MKSRMMRAIGILGLLLWLISALAFGQSTASIPGLPGALNWQNTPRSWNIDSKNVLTISSNKWDAGALMVWGDDHHWAKLSFEFSPDSKPTLVTVVTRGLSDDCNSMHLPGDSAYLRIAKSGNTYVFYFSTDGQSWRILRTFSLDTELPVRVGFESQSPAGPGAVAKFSAITYEPHRIENIYK